MNKKLFISTIILLSSLLSLSRAFAEYNSEMLGNAIGGYLITTDLLEKLSNSQCGYAIKMKYSFKTALEEVVPYLNEHDKQEMRTILQSEDFMHDIEDNSEFIKGMMDSGKHDGLDEKTICGLLICSVSMNYESAKIKWEDAKKLYSKSQPVTDMKEVDYAKIFKKMKERSAYYFEEEMLEKELYSLDRLGQKNQKKYKEIQQKMRLHKENFQEWSNLLIKQKEIQDTKSKEYEDLQLKIEVLEDLLKMN